MYLLEIDLIMKSKSKIKQLTIAESVTLDNSKDWEDWTDEKIFLFQINQKLMCLDFSRFHKAAEAILGRPVSHLEFATTNKQALLNEYYSKKENK